MTDDQPLLVAEEVGKLYGGRVGCRDVSFALWPGEVLAIVGESGSGKSTLLKCLSMQLEPSSGRVHYRLRDKRMAALDRLSETERRYLMRTDWGFVHQDPREGLRMGVSAGANIGERLMAVGERHYGRIRGAALDWLDRVEIKADRIDDSPSPIPAACGNGCRSPAIWSPGHASSSWTSPPAGSTSRSRRGCSI
jgi:putative phosphonate transport system ATP-binding protein